MRNTVRLLRYLGEQSHRSALNKKESKQPFSTAASPSTNCA